MWLITCLRPSTRATATARMVALATWLGGLGVLSPTRGHAQATLTLDDLARLIEVSDPRISPDGRSVAMVVARANYDANRYDAELVLVDIASGAQRVLTHNRPRVRHPRWSPNGDRLAFIDGGHEGSMPQVYVWPMVGGDAQSVTAAPRGVVTFAWRPDGKAMAYVAEDEPPTRTGEDKHNKSFQVGDHDYLAQQAPSPWHLWLIEPNGSNPQRLTSGLAGVNKSAPEPFGCSHDGRAIAFASQPRPHSGELDRGSLELLDVATGDRRPLVRERGLAQSVAYSPDGENLAYSFPLGPGPWFNPHAIYVRPAAGGESKLVTEGIDRTLYGSAWMPDGRSLLVGNADGTHVSLWQQPLDGPHRRLALGDVQPNGWGDIDVGPQGSVVFVGTEARRPGELYYLASLDDRPRRLTSFNDAIARLRLGQVEPIRWDGPNGFAEDGVLVFPPDYREGRRYPLVLSIHGGPMGSSTEAFSILPQLMAARGWIVFSPNYRGSGNRGAEYQRAVIGDAGEGPGRDVMAGLRAVKARRIVDEARVAVSGWSYGGYMTTWLTGHYEGWRAAVAGAALTDYSDSYNLSDLNVVFGYAFNTSPWRDDGRDMYRKQSPMSYAHRIRTPTLILSNTGDLRVPITQSYKLFHALKDNGVTVEFVAYPIPGHFPADPVHRRDVYRRWMEWIEQHFEERATSGR